MGNFSLTLDDSPDIREEVHLALNYNFNGMVHAGEDNDPDNVDGFRGISDRALRQTGAPGSIEVGLEGSSGIGYSVPDQAGVLDIVHLGNRNLVDTFNWAFDLVADGDDVGVQPAWLADPDQTAPQVSDVSSLGLEMTADTRIGVLFNASNGGSNFEMALGFAGGSVVTISLSAPDWFGDQVPTPPAFGVESQLQFGLYSGAGLVDSGVPSVDLNVVEAIVSVQDLINDGFGDITGLVLESVAFQNSFNPNAGTAIYAVTVQDALSEPSCIADFDGNGTVAVPDIFAFLSAWFAGSGSADINGDMDVTVPDIFAFLSLWFAGCP
jgi:hypothetical protein